jgi:hypothetical protein
MTTVLINTAGASCEIYLAPAVVLKLNIVVSLTAPANRYAAFFTIILGIRNKRM